MSYRSIKRVLGETRLELKCLLLFAICLLTLIGSSFWWYGSKTEHIVVDNSRDICRNLIDAVMLELHWKIDQPRRDLDRLMQELDGKITERGNTDTILLFLIASSESVGRTLLQMNSKIFWLRFPPRRRLRRRTWSLAREKFCPPNFASPKRASTSTFNQFMRRVRRLRSMS